MLHSKLTAAAFLAFSLLVPGIATAQTPEPITQDIFVSDCSVVLWGPCNDISVQFLTGLMSQSPSYVNIFADHKNDSTNVYFYNSSGARVASYSFDGVRLATPGDTLVITSAGSQISLRIPVR